MSALTGPFDLSSPEPAALPPGLPTLSPLPRFPVNITPPDLYPWREPRSGIPGVVRLDSDRPGPHVALTALMHGNEFAG
ncbi:MAG: hypothetical protein INR65_12685, partial [Gluconacetobacter diazotrophicus]|nr:hypothetical protein [Gluconacetobacter diazotrophicus]